MLKRIRYNKMLMESRSCQIISNAQYIPIRVHIYVHVVNTKTVYDKLLLHAFIRCCDFVIAAGVHRTMQNRKLCFTQHSATFQQSYVYCKVNVHILTFSLFQSMLFASISTTNTMYRGVFIEFRVFKLYLHFSCIYDLFVASFRLIKSAVISI